MKELSIEEKAKRYDELLLKLQKAKVDDNVCDEMYYRVIDDIVPELRESEDEKVREVLIGYFKRYKEEECGIKTFYGIPADDILAWLEKQGTRPRYNIGDVICDKLCTTLNKEAQPNMEIVDIRNGMYICDKGSFPVSQQDEYELVGKKIDMKPVDSVNNELREASLEHARNEMMSTTFPNNMTFEFAYNFEEGAKWYAAQKSVWSEEDECRTEKLLGWLNTLINYIQGDATVSLDLYRERERQVEIIKTWLKSLKDRHAWKPSDEQIEALNYVVNLMASSGSIRENYYCIVFKDLREQLKRLK